MTHLSHIFAIRTSPPTSLTLEQQRKKWLMEFLKTYAVLVIVYGGFYLLRTNFKSAQPFLVEQVGLTTTQLGTIGFAFSLTYGFGGLILGFFIDGKNTKKVISALLLASGVTSILIGLVLAWFHSPYGWMILLWSLNGLFQAPGGPCCNSTMNRWSPVPCAVASSAGGMPRTTLARWWRAFSLSGARTRCSTDLSSACLSSPPSSASQSAYGAGSSVRTIPRSTVGTLPRRSSVNPSRRLMR